MKHTLAILALPFLLVACGQSADEHRSILVQVAPQQVTCEGITKQRCFQVRFADEAPWQLYYGEIKGFDYQPGFLYRLKVEQLNSQRDNPNLSPLAWGLVKELKRTPASELPKQPVSETTDKPTDSLTATTRK